MTIKTNKKSGMPLREMGHILNTPSVREAEKKHGCALEGYTASWSLSGNFLRVYVKESFFIPRGRWRGPYILTANDVEIY